MLWVEMHLPSGIRRVSNEALATDSHFYEPDLASLSQFRYSMDRLYGGYVRPSYGRFEFLPTAFENDWPPPDSFPVTVYWDEDDGYKTLLDGTLYITDQAEDSVTYIPFEQEFTGRFTDHVYDNKIAGASGLFVNNVPYIDPNLTANYVLGDDVNAPYISFTDTGDKLVLNSLSDVCAVGTHMFYRDGLVMRLVDMFTDNGSREITEFDYFSWQRRHNTPYADYRCGDYSVAGFSFADRSNSVTPIFHNDAQQAQEDYDTAVRELELAQASLDANPTDSDLIAARDARQSDVDAAANTLANAKAADETEITKGLNRIKQILEMPQITVKMPITQGIPNFGERVSFVSESGLKNINVWLRVRGMVLDFDNDQIVLVGEGEVA